MLKRFALLLLSVTAAHAYPQLSGLTTYEMMPDVTTDEMMPGVLEDEPSEEQTNDIIPDQYDPQKHSGEHEDLLEVTAKCGYTSDSKETTLESVSWKAEFEEIAQNIRLFAERCGSLRRKAQNLDSEWENYKTKYGKSYESPEEDSTRRELYFKNKAEIEAHNLLYRKGLTSYSMGLNHFSDMRFEEMGAMLGSTEESYGNISAPNVDFYVPSNLTLPFSVDWRRKGAVTGVKSQGKCGSCWAFSTTGAIEGQWKIHKGRLLSLSEQQLVDCSHANPNKGCKYGNVISALKDIRRSGGIESEQAYPYKSRSSGREGKCRFNRRKVVATVRGWAQLPSGNEAALRDAVANKGPVSVMIHLSKKFAHYRSGIFDEPHCKGTNHIMLAVGYGVQKGHSYWLIKNSWGSGWGSGGYVMMSRNKGNQCMIATHACYPVV